MGEHRKSRLKTHAEGRYDLVMPVEYFEDTIRLQLCSLLEEDALKDTTITLRGGIVTVSSCILSLVSPVLRTMLCGNFRESTCKAIILDDVEAKRFSKLLRLGCGQHGLVAEDADELLELGQLAQRLQMEAVRSRIEDVLVGRLTAENCSEMFERSEGRGLEGLQKECYKVMRDKFEEVSRTEGLLMLSEETLEELLEEDELKAGREEDVLEAVVWWMSNSDEGMRGERLLRKVRYGVMSNAFLAENLSSALLPGYGMLKELAGEAMAKKEGQTDTGVWDGVERLCGKWMVARGMKGRIIGADSINFLGYIAIDLHGRIVVSDQYASKIIIFDHDGSVARHIGSDGAGAGQINGPMGVAVDRQGHIVVADSWNHRIQVLNADGTVVRRFGCKGTAVGQLNRPCGVAIDREGRIVVADHANHRIQVFDADGSVVRHFGSYGAEIGQMHLPAGVAVDAGGRIVVADQGNHRVQVFNGDGTVSVCFGSRGSGPGQLDQPCGVAVDSAGRFIVADMLNVRVKVFNTDGSVARVIGALVGCPEGVVVDGAGRIVVTGLDQVQVL